MPIHSYFHRLFNFWISLLGLASFATTVWVFGFVGVPTAKVVTTVIYAVLPVLFLIDGLAATRESRKLDPPTVWLTVLSVAVLLMALFSSFGLPTGAIVVISVLASLPILRVCWMIIRARRLLLFAIVPSMIASALYLVPLIVPTGGALGYLIVLPPLLSFVGVAWGLAARWFLIRAEQYRGSPVQGPAMESLSMLFLFTPSTVLTMLTVNAFGIGDTWVAVSGVMVGLIFGSTISQPFREFVLDLGYFSTNHESSFGKQLKMIEDWEKGKSGPLSPSEVLSLLDGAPLPSIEAPVFRFISDNLSTDWSMKNREIVWNSPIYDELSNVWSVTMEGIAIQKAEGFGNTVKGIVVSRMMARGLSLARTACWAMAVGSPMDALACYRMIYDRALTLQFLDKNNQYEDFERYCWAEAFFWLSDGDSLPLWRKQATREEIQSHKDRQAKIRQNYFGGATPTKPDTYWRPPRSEDLVRGFSLHPIGLPEPQNSELLKAMSRLYELGSKAVHPRIGDMMETDELGWSADSKECMDLILMALTSLTAFGLSRYSETEFLAEKIVELATGHTTRA